MALSDYATLDPEEFADHALLDELIFGELLLGRLRHCTSFDRMSRVLDSFFRRLWGADYPANFARFLLAMEALQV